MQPVEIVAEVGCNHLGDRRIMEESVGAAKACGADTVKFQLYKTNLLVNPGPIKDHCRQCELTKDAIEFLRASAKDHGIKLLFSVFDLPSLERVIREGFTTVKIPSGQAHNLDLVRRIAEQSYMRLYISTGMMDSWKLQEVLRLIQDCRSLRNVRLLHTTTAYPCPPEEADLRVIPHLKRMYNCKIGFSDHTEGIGCAVAAVALGARVIEKHFTVIDASGLPDGPVSLGPVKFEEMVRQIRAVEAATKISVKRVCPSETPMLGRRANAR